MFGVFLDPLFLSTSYQIFKEHVIEAERLGYESVWVSDHLMTGNKPVYECFSMLSALASATKKIKLGSLVACNSYRTPSVLAKISATVDVISNGRLEFGIGAGWDEEEYNAYGITFPKPDVRVTQLKEGVEIIRRMWTENSPSYSGKYFSIRGAYCEPKPIQKPHPPITIGGGGEKMTLKVVAEYANRWNWMGSVQEFNQKLNALKIHCTRADKNYSSIEKSFMGRIKISNDRRELRSFLQNLYSTEQLYFGTPTSFKQWFERLQTMNIVGTPDECVERIREYMDLGVGYFMLTFLDLPSMHDMRLFAEQIKVKI
ncbi:TIGR03560 family F420-dependent LLM class oxidoreductase [Candidatus Bathyarchaeota archaeon]|nr:TIGR03560 family F420-dependent LLM class oxidoreductase [Candidatus Bathyarchaeota archaeon]